MAQLTLLQYVQNILSALNSDQVNSIGDTPESLQVAECVRTTYMNMLGRYDMPEHNQLINLTASNDVNIPTLMFRPAGISRIEWVKYFDTNPLDTTSVQVDQFGAYSHDIDLDLQNNAGGVVTSSTSTNTIGFGQLTFTVPSGLNLLAGETIYTLPVLSPNQYMFGTITSYNNTTLIIQVTSAQGSGSYSNWTVTQSGPASLAFPGYKEVRILSVEDFMHMVDKFNLTEDNVSTYTLEVTNFDTQQPMYFHVNFKNDKQPQYCCIVSNYYVLFDSYDNTQDSTLQSSKTKVMAWVVPQFQMYDTFVPNLQDQQVPLLLNDAKSLAFFEIKNQPHQKAEEEVGRQLVSLQKWKAIADKPGYFDELPNYGRRGNMFP